MKKFEIFILIIAISLSASSAQAVMFNNGAVNNITSNISTATVYDNPSPPPLQTTVNLKPGGSITNSFNVYDSSIANLYAGSIGADLSTGNTSTANILGGTIGGNIYAWESSTVNIYGQDFFIDGSPVAYGAVSATSGLLTGTLHKGDLLSVDFYRLTGASPNSTINLIETEIVPLPGAVLLGGLGLITAGWRLRKRRTA